MGLWKNPCLLIGAERNAKISTCGPTSNAYQ